MATKTALLATINGFITALINVTKHRSSMSAVVDEMYSNSVYDNNATETYTTKSGTDIDYRINIKKSGNVAHLKGQINISSGTSFLSNVNVFAWKNNEFKTKANSVSNPNISFKAFTTGGESASLELTSSGLKVLPLGAIQMSKFYDFNITYITQD